MVWWWATGWLTPCLLTPPRGCRAKVWGNMGKCRCLDYCWSTTRYASSGLLSYITWNMCLRIRHDASILPSIVNSLEQCCCKSLKPKPKFRNQGIDKRESNKSIQKHCLTWHSCDCSRPISAHWLHDPKNVRIPKVQKPILAHFKPI